MSIQNGLFLFSAVKNRKYTIPLGEGKKLSSNRRNPANSSILKYELPISIPDTEIELA